MAGKSKEVLKISENAELLSYIINESPILSQEIDLPVQGEGIQNIGKIIVNNQRYRNAFINTINVIALTVIKRNAWRDDWDFTVRGALSNGMTVREIIADLCDVYDYNEAVDNPLRFTQTAVPNILQYLHNVNFQKFYETTTNDMQMSMAFNNDDGLFDLIDTTIGMLWESWIYDRFIINKYMLCRRILDGTITSYNIDGYDTLTPRQRVAAMKSVSNRLTFRSPNFNPAAIRKATSFDDQIFILNSQFEADLSTDVLATSYFRGEADYKARCKLIDSFADHDTKRLAQVLGTSYIPFTDDELSQLKTVPAVVISQQWFMDYEYNIGLEGDITRMTEFYNPVTHMNNHYLSVWYVFSTSPFENAVVFTSGVEPTVINVTISPAAVNIYNNTDADYYFSAKVDTTGFANKAVYWTIEPETVGVNLFSSITQDGVLHYKSGDTSDIKVTATSIFDNTKSASVLITVTEPS